MNNPFKWTAAVFCTLIFGLALLFWTVPDRSFSEEEKRGLQELPHFSVKSFAEGSFEREMDLYFQDQFPARALFVEWKAHCEQVFGKGENDGILIGKNGQLARRKLEMLAENGEKWHRFDLPDQNHVARSLEGIRRAEENLSVRLSVILAPRTLDVAASAFTYPAGGGDLIYSMAETALGKSCNFVNPLPMLREQYDLGKTVCYRTDHHWTTEGAYLVYAQWMESIGRGSEVIPEEKFTRRIASDSFFGTLWSSCGMMKEISPDNLEFWLLGEEDSFTVTADGKELDGFYSEAYLQNRDCYASFLDGTHDRVTVTKKGSGPRPTLLILKDSFANCMAPFLARHFDLVLLNLSSVRTDFTNLSELADAYAADEVLLLYTMENMLISDKLSNLR